MGRGRSYNTPKRKETHVINGIKTNKICSNCGYSVMVKPIGKLYMAWCANCGKTRVNGQTEELAIREFLGD